MDKNILYTAIQAALAAGAEIMSVYTDPKADFEIEKKADNSPLTIADRKSHAIIAQALAATPYPVLSEEGAKIAPEERQQWGEFTVNIAYVKNGCPEAGVIYIPVKQELYFADIELGAYKIKDITDTEAYPSLDALMEQAERLPYANRTDDTFVIVASRSHLTPETEAYIHEMQQKHAHVETISKGSSLKLQGKFVKVVPHCRRKRGRISPLRSHDGMGHRSRPCHYPCCRKGSLSGWKNRTATI